MRRPSKIGFLIVPLALVAACGGDGGEGTTVPDEDTAASTTTAGSDDEVVTTTTASPGEDQAATTMPAEMGEGIHAAETDLGSILVDPDGFTVYIFTADSGGESTCYDACADLWPPVPADTTIGGDLDASLFGATTRTDGSEQLTVNGMPLYLYTPDTNPGDVSGQGLNGVWFVVDAAGDIIEAAAEGAAPVDYGY